MEVMELKRRVLGFLVFAAGIIAAVVIWTAITALFDIPPYLLPSPQDILRRMVRDWRQLASGTGYTLVCVLYGFALSVLVGIPLALLITSSRTTERLLMPLVVMSQTMPKVAIAPILIIWLGFGILPKIAITFLIAFFPIVISTAVGLKSVETDMIDLVRSMGATKIKLLLRVRMPAALPHLFAGLKIGICLAVVGAIVGEFVGSDDGLGYLILISSGSLDGPMTWAALVLLITMGILLFAIVGWVERWVIPWHVSVRTEDAMQFQP
jgi:NitT/TauT family transport system permease protein